MKYAKRWCLLLALAWLPGLACAGSTIQAGMTISGHVEIAPDGSVTGYQLDRPSRIPSAAKALVAKAVPAWKFAPVRVDGKAVPARSAMRIHLVARQMDKGGYTIGIDSAWFRSKDAVNGTDTLRVRDRTSPRYPAAAVKERVQGTVYTVLRINRQGKVDKLAIRQVNLRTRGSSAQMRRWRQWLAEASEKAVKDWIFTPPTTGPEAGHEYWVAVMPVIFRLKTSAQSKQAYRADRYGKWQSCIPGPRQSIPWVKDAEKRLLANADALPGNGVFSGGQTLHLLTPLSGGS